MYTLLGHYILVTPSINRLPSRHFVCDRKWHTGPGKAFDRLAWAASENVTKWDDVRSAVRPDSQRKRPK